MTLLAGLDTALEDARAAVARSDKAQFTGHSFTLQDATQGETRALRDAVRALIQAVETLAREARMASNDSDTCRGCCAKLGYRHFIGCPYEHPWPNDRVDHVQTQIAPVASTAAALPGTEKT